MPSFIRLYGFQLHGLPLFGLIVCVLSASVLRSACADDHGISPEVANEFSVAWHGDGFQNAEALLRYQLSDDPDNPQLRFRLAVALGKLDESKKQAESLTLLRRLVDDDQHEEAARGLVNQLYLGRQWSRLNPEERVELGGLLALVNDAQPEDVSVQHLYADYLIASERLADALPLLEKLAIADPMRDLQCAIILQELGKVDEANQRANSTLEKLNDLHQKDPTDPVATIAVAKNMRLLDRYAEAITMLDRMMRESKKMSDRERIRDLIRDSFARWAADIQVNDPGEDSRSDPVRVFGLLEIGFQRAPNDDSVQALLADQVLGMVHGDEEEKALRLKALTDHASSAVSHLINGAAALMSDDLDNATTHLKKASVSIPKTAAVLNSFSHEISDDDDNHLEASLRLSEKAIEMARIDTPFLYANRGQLLFRLGRFADAIPDLQRALEIDKHTVKTHTSLAECHARLGDEKLSKFHRQEAEKAGEQAAPRAIANVITTSTPADKAFAEAWEMEDYQAAENILREQLTQTPDAPEILFRLALALSKQVGEDDEPPTEPIETMRRLVNDHQHEEAARWLLSKLYVGHEWSQLDKEQQEEFGNILALINLGKPNDAAIQQLYADYLIAAERLSDAVPLLDRLSRRQPIRGLQCAAILRKLGREEEANQRAESALQRVSELSEREPNNTVLSLAVAQNQLFLQRYTDAVKTLDRAIRVTKTKKDALRLNQAMGDSMVAWITHIRKTENPDDPVAADKRVLKMLQTALQYAPNNPRVLTQLADQVFATLGEDDAEVVKLREHLVANASPAISHFVDGTVALMRNDVETATTHLTLASELMPRSGAILNNLAVAISTRGDEQLEQALKLSEKAIEMTPNATPHFYESRGQILLRMERYLDAVPDLERALAVEKLRPNAHKSLAVCYENLGDDVRAEHHREEANQSAD
tara:strand:- start:349795 stop:352608 length:2814 start_codon:yes stop_codon:yes gene_type:complete